MRSCSCRGRGCEVGSWQLAVDSWQMSHGQLPTDNCQLGAGRVARLLAALGRLLGRVDDVAQILARLEADILRRRDGDLLVGAGVAAFARFALAHGKTSQTGDCATFAALTRVGDVADECIERRRGLFL